MLDKIVGHQRHIAQAYGISMEHARWLLTTVAFHCLAVADTVYRSPNGDPSWMTVPEEAGWRPNSTGHVHALIVGMLALMDADGLFRDS